MSASNYDEANEWVGDLMLDAAENALTIAERIGLANVLATLALADALRSPTAPAAPVPPGPCWDDSGSVWFGNRPRCELLAGHAGAHVWRDGNGGERVWPNRTGGQEAER